MKIYLIRHGETTGDIEDRYGGDYDDHLTEKGRKQAEVLVEKLKSKNIEAIFTSNLIRAQETAKILQEKLGGEIKTINALRERNLYGPLTGMVKSEAKEKYPDLVERIKNVQDTIEGGEDWKVFVDRIVGAMKSISKMDYKVVAIVTHGGPIRRIFWELLDIRKQQGEIKIGDCAHAELEVLGGKINLIAKEGIDYLDVS